MRGRFSQEAWRDISSGLPAGTVLVGFTSIPWRESWKYGERAFRYLQINLGHALAAISFASAALGWRATLLDGLGTGEVGLLLGVAAPGETEGSEAFEGDIGEPVDEPVDEPAGDPRAPNSPETEIPDCIVAVHPQGRSISGFALSDRVLDEFRGLRWHGVPDRLSSRRVYWPLLEGVAEATSKPPRSLVIESGSPIGSESVARRVPSPKVDPPSPSPSPSTPPSPSPSLRSLIRERRSAIVMDPAFSISRDDFYSALERMISAPGTFPHHLHPWMPQVHLAIFVHRVLGLDRGLYLLVRDLDHEDLLRKSMRGEFEWSRPEGAPQGFRRLARGDFRDIAAALSCRQKIASDGCFSIAMIARFRSCLEEHGPWFYNRLFWECGIVGQALYLEAERRGLRGCGIGCYFDDLFASALGLSGTDWQSLYAFAVGREAPLRKIETLPGYPPSISSREKVKSP
ncbi:SagB/ThcOx family dehydrogenase [Candidatus Methanocrinis natronophilus]|uniref:Nitroreductase family protein n=1 Tax=Candidatus Methanocrinis natronophilus TaxID=3033396 RepID=A0ABT5X8G7_9EURY|nr:nitroreductase family protein [Candidatus Methanocrinis natronophilus]MDF0590994.1 nitroreductase family protein [Candidatus Methanocrinis natronophilus]